MKTVQINQKHKIMPKFKEHQFIVLTESITSCGCTTANKGTLGKVSHVYNNGDINVIFCNSSCETMISEDSARALQPGFETINAKKRFEEANQFRYASFN
jgi:hypothetical protein